MRSIYLATWVAIAAWVLPLAGIFVFTILRIWPLVLLCVAALVAQFVYAAWPSRKAAAARTGGALLSARARAPGPVPTGSRYLFEAPPEQPMVAPVIGQAAVAHQVPAGAVPLPLSGAITPTFVVDQLLAAAYSARLTATIGIWSEQTRLFFLGLELGEVLGAWGGGPDGDPSATQKTVAATGLAGTAGDQAFVRALSVSSGTYEVTPGRPVLPGGARLSPMRTRGRISEGGDLYPVLGAARLHRFTGTIAILPDESSAPISLGLEAGRITAAWGGGDDQHPEDTTRLLADLGYGDGAVGGDRTYARVLTAFPAVFEVTPGEPVVPTSARLSRGLTEFLSQLFMPGEAAVPRPSALWRGPSGLISRSATVDGLLSTAHQESFTGTITIRPPSSQDPFILALEDGWLKAAWGGGADDNPKLTAELAGDLGVAGCEGDRAYVRANFRVPSGTFEVTPGEPAIPPSARLSKKLLNHRRGVEGYRETFEPARGTSGSPEAALNPGALWVTSKVDLFLRPWVLPVAWRWVAGCLLVGFGSLALSAFLWTTNNQGPAIAGWLIFGVPAAVGSLVAGRLHGVVYLLMVPVLFFSSIFLMANAGTLYLSGHGVRTEARVAEVTESCVRGSCTRTWHLVAPSGRSIGQTEDLPDSTGVGSHLVVIYDPHGIADPETPSDVATTVSNLGGAIAGIVLALSILLLSILVNLLWRLAGGRSSQHPATNWAILSRRERRSNVLSGLMVIGTFLVMAGPVLILVTIFGMSTNPAGIFIGLVVFLGGIGLIILTSQARSRLPKGDTVGNATLSGAG